MQRTRKAFLAAGVAATTLISGLSLSSTAAVAAPGRTVQDDHPAGRPFKFVFHDKAVDKYYGIAFSQASTWEPAWAVEKNSASDAAAASEDLVPVYYNAPGGVPRYVLMEQDSYDPSTGRGECLGHKAGSQYDTHVDTHGTCDVKGSVPADFLFHWDDAQGSYARVGLPDGVGAITRATTYKYNNQWLTVADHSLKNDTWELIDGPTDPGVPKTLPVLQADVPRTAPGGTTEWVTTSIDQAVQGLLTVTAPAGTTIVSAEGVRAANGIPDVIGTITNDGRTATLGGNETTWSPTFRTLRFKIRVDDDAIPSSSLTGGSMKIVRNGSTTAEGEFSVPTGVGDGGLIAAASPSTPLTRGQSVRVPFAVEATTDYDELDGKITLRAPAGTTFDTDATVAGQWRTSSTAPWSGDDPTLVLTDVQVSSDGRELTAAFDSANSPNFAQRTGYQLRWLAPVTADDDAAAGDGTLGYSLDGTTNHGAVEIDSTSATTIPEAAVVIAPPVVDEPAAGATVTVSRPTFTGTGQPRATIRIGYGPNSTIGSATVGDDGSWSLTPVAGLALGTSDLTVTQTAGTDVQTIHHQVVRVPAAVPFAVTSHVTGQSYAQGVATFSGTGTTGSTVEARNQWGTLMGKATVGANGTWSFDRNLGPTTAGYDITFTQVTPGGDTSAVSLHLVYTGVLALQVTKPADNSTYTPGVATFVGRAAPNAVVTATNQWGTRMGRAVTGLDGTWTFDRNLGPTTNGYEITFVATKDGKTQSTVLHLVQEVTKAPVTVTSIADGDTYRPGLNVLAGTGTPGATVKAVNATNGWNVPMGQAKVGADGRWELPERNWGPSNDYEILVTQTDPDTTTSSTTVTVKAPRWQPLVVTTPAVDDTYENLVPVHFSGTSTPYATITVRSAQSDTVYRTVEADSHGNWSFDRAWGPNHTYTLIFDQLARDGQSDSVTGFVWAPHGE